MGRRPRRSWHQGIKVRGISSSGHFFILRVPSREAWPAGSVGVVEKVQRYLAVRPTAGSCYMNQNIVPSVNSVAAFHTAGVYGGASMAVGIDVGDRSSSVHPWHSTENLHAPHF
jgi:hypothetical protein